MLNLLIIVTLAILAHAELGCLAATFVYDPSVCSTEGVDAPTLKEYQACSSKSSLYAPAQSACESVTYRKAAMACDAPWRTCAAANGCADQVDIQYGGCDACDDTWDNCYEEADYKECNCFVANQKKYCSPTSTKHTSTIKTSSTKRPSSTTKHPTSSTKKPTPTSKKCSLSSGCKQKIPSNSHRYCLKGVCTFRCNKQYTLSKGKKGCVPAPA